MRKRKLFAPEVIEAAAEPRNEITSEGGTDDGGTLSRRRRQHIHGRVYEK